MNKQEEQQYIKGFNYGYQLSQYEPDLLHQVLSTNNNRNNFIDGIKAGQKEHVKELELVRLQDQPNLKGKPGRLPSWLQKDRFTENAVDQTKDKSLDREIEPEK